MLNEYREDLRTECEKFGAVKKVILFDVSLKSSCRVGVLVNFTGISTKLFCGCVCAAETPGRRGICRL